MAAKKKKDDELDETPTRLVWFGGEGKTSVVVPAHKAERLIASGDFSEEKPAAKKAASK